jgi:phosphoribosylformylglycinamidine synthase
MVGPWQVPVADVAATLADYSGHAGEAFAMGERTPLALIDAPASGRMAVGEALTNLAAAHFAALGRVRLSANWMAAAGHPGEDAALFDTVRAVRDLSIALGVSIPVGKDSLSMRTTWRDGGDDKSVTAPVSLIVSAFTRLDDARRVATPQLALDVGETCLIRLDVSPGRRRLGGSALAQAFAQLGDEAPDVDDAARLGGFVALVQSLHADGTLLAYHDIGDGGLFATLCEMAFASRCGLDVDLAPADAPLGALFAEELGAVVQVGVGRAEAVIARGRDAGLGAVVIGRPVDGARLRIAQAGEVLLDESRVDLHRAWSSTTHALQRLRDNPACADEEHGRIGDVDDPGLVPSVAVDPAEELGTRRRKGARIAPCFAQPSSSWRSRTACCTSPWTSCSSAATSSGRSPSAAPGRLG